MKLRSGKEIHYQPHIVVKICDICQETQCSKKTCNECHREEIRAYESLCDAKVESRNRVQILQTHILEHTREIENIKMKLHVRYRAHWAKYRRFH